MSQSNLFYQLAGGGPGHIVTGTVNSAGDLPTASLHAGELWVVLTSTGFLWSLQKGLWRSNGTTWERLSNSTLFAEAFTLDTVNQQPRGVGKLIWNVAEGVPEIGLSPSVTLQIGQEGVIKVHNHTGSLIPNGTPVYISGASGGLPLITPALASLLSASLTLALTTEDIADNGTGFATIYGLVRDLNTSAFSVGDVLYLGPSGGLTNTKPIYPDTAIMLGTCLVSDAALGIVDVDIRSEAYQKGFDVIRAPHGTVDRAQSTLSYNPATRQASIAPVSGYWAYFRNGLEYRQVDAVTLTHANTSGAWFFYVNAAGSFVLNQTPWSLLTDIPLLYINYNATDVDGVAIEERHGCQRNLEWHKGQHDNIGTYYISGLAASGYVVQGSVDADNTYGIATGVIRDEDLPSTLAGQIDAGTYNLYYRSGVAGDWRRQALPRPFAVGGTYIQYNQWTGATWQLTELTNGEFVNYYVVAVPSIDGTRTIWIIPSQLKHTGQTLAEAERFADGVAWGVNPFSEFCLIHRFTMRASSGYTTTGKCRIESYADLRGSTTRIQIVNGAQVNFHDSLNGVYKAAAGVAYGHIDDQAQTIAGQKTFTGALLATGLKSGTSQVNAGAVAGELWVDTSAGNVIKRGV